MEKTIEKSLALLCLTLVLIFLSGCVASSGSFGRLQKDYEVKETFENFEVPDGYLFYYSGPDKSPKAFLGIAEGYTLEASLWHPVDLTSETLRSWIWGHAHRQEGDPRPFGSRIVGPQGEQIGIYYSLGPSDQWARIELTGPNTVKIGGPIGNDRRRKSWPDYILDD